MIARLVASASVSQGRVSPWLIGAVSPRASACCTSTSMTMPFSACIMIIAPLLAAVCMARRTWPSSL